MLLNSRDGQAHLFRYFPERQFVDAAADKYTPALRRQAIDSALDVAQFVAGAQRRFGGKIGLQAFDIRDIVERHYGVAPRAIDQEISGDTEQIMLAVRYFCPIISCIGACQCLSDDIVEIGIRR